MKMPSRVCCCALILLFVLLTLCSNPGSGMAQSNPSHGGKIEVSYDGFNHETVISLQKMRVSCDGVKGLNKNECVSIAVSLHCLGEQAYKVNYVTLQLMFATSAWDQRHAMDQRNLSVVVNNETLRVGQMKLVSQSVNESMTETLGITFPYEIFKKMADAQFVEMQVGPSRFMLRNKNLEALRDMDKRVVVMPK
jgi:hypothetical protein